MPENNEKITDNTEGEKRHVLRTLKADTADYIKTRKISLLDLAAMKERAKEKQPFIPPTRTPLPFYKKGVFVTIIIILLFTAAGGAGYYFYFLNKAPSTQPAPILNPPSPLLSSQQEKIIYTTGQADLKNRLKAALEETYAPGDLIYLPIKLEKEESAVYLSSTSFLKFIGAETPSRLNAFIENVFFLGILNTDKKHPVLIFEIQKGLYETAYAGMLQWESTMLKDLSFFFEPEDARLDSARQAGKTGANFKDALVKNHSVRIAETDKAGVLLYTVLNRSYIIITDTAAGLEELINRFEIYKFS